MFIVRLLRLFQREIKIIWMDWRLVVIVFLMPFAYTALVGYLYLPMRVSEISTYIIDQDNSQLSRSIVTAIDVNDSMKVVGYLNNVEEFKEKIRHREGYACFWIPKYFERDVKKGRAVKLVSLIDGSNMIISNTILAGAAKVAGSFSAGIEIKKLNMKGTPKDYTLSNAMPLNSISRIAYNPSYNYTIFIMLGMIGTIVQQIVLVGCALAFAHEREHGLVGGIFKITQSPLEVLIAKSLFYTSINMITAFGAYIMGVHLFGLHLNGSLFLCMILLFTFIFTIVAFGIAVSAICADSVFATEVLMLVSLPSFLLSGFTWPRFAMIPVIKLMSWVLPLTHFIMPFRSVFMQEGDYSTIKPDMIWLWCLAMMSYAAAYFVIYRSMLKARKELTGA